MHLSICPALGGFERGLYVEKWAPFVKVSSGMLFTSLIIHLTLIAFIFLYMAFWFSFLFIRNQSISKGVKPSPIQRSLHKALPVSLMNI